MPNAFASDSALPAAAVFAAAALLDAEKLDAYRVALEFQAITRTPADKRRFYSMARGSATECAAILDLLGARGLVDDRLRSRARSLLVRIVQMLSRLVARMAAPNGPPP